MVKKGILNNSQVGVPSSLGVQPNVGSAELFTGETLTSDYRLTLVTIT